LHRLHDGSKVDRLDVAEEEQKSDIIRAQSLQNRSGHAQGIRKDGFDDRWRYALLTRCNRPNLAQKIPFKTEVGYTLALFMNRVAQFPRQLRFMPGVLIMPNRFEK